MSQNMFTDIRKDFPALNQKIKGKPPIYFDNACTTLRPQVVIDAMNAYYVGHPGCHKRAVHTFGKRTTDAYRQAKEVVTVFLGAGDKDEIIFTKNTTESINLVANGFPLREGDVVLTSDCEHNSNFLPWQLLSQRKGVEHRMFPLNLDTTFNLENFQAALTPEVKIVSVFHSSHITGVSLPVTDITKLAHEKGAFVFIDGAQSVCHQDIDVQSMDADFFACSFHKMLGPSGMGCLYGKKALLENITPLLMGGEAVDDVSDHSFVCARIPDRFEPGLQNYAGAMGAAAAGQYLNNLGINNIRKHLVELNEFITREISAFPRIILLGPKQASARAGIINFHVEGMDSGELSLLLDQSENIMTRSGVHCCHPWYKRQNLPTTLRVSLSGYNSLQEAEVFVDTLRKIVKYY